MIKLNLPLSRWVVIISIFCFQVFAIIEWIRGYTTPDLHLVIWGWFLWASSLIGGWFWYRLDEEWEVKRNAGNSDNK